MPTIEKIAVLGAGTMGTGIASLADAHGIPLTLYDIDDKALQDAPPGAETTTSLEDAVAHADLVLESVPEELETKRDVMTRAERHAPRNAILASNTSAIPITWIAEPLEGPERAVGMHFFHPVDRMNLVELVPGKATTEDSLDQARRASTRMGKDTVTLQRDPPGFVTTRLICALGLAAMRAQDARLASRDAIDAGLLAFGFPMGPFQVTDFSGLDVFHATATFLGEHLNPAYEPPAWLGETVDENRLGAKTGTGFYDWSHGLPQPDPSEDETFQPELLMAVVVNEATPLVADQVAGVDVIDQATRKGLGFPKGPFEWAREEGLETVLDHLDELHEATGDPLARPREALATDEPELGE